MEKIHSINDCGTQTNSGYRWFPFAGNDGGLHLIRREKQNHGKGQNVFAVGGVLAGVVLRGSSNSSATPQSESQPLGEQTN